MRGWGDEERPLVTPSTHCCRWGQSHPLLLAFLIVVRYDSSWVAGTRLSSSMWIKAAHCRQEPTDSLSWCKGDGTRVFSREVQEPPVQDEGEEVVSSPSPVCLIGCFPFLCYNTQIWGESAALTVPHNAKGKHPWVQKASFLSFLFLPLPPFVKTDTQFWICFSQWECWVVSVSVSGWENTAVSAHLPAEGGEVTWGISSCCLRML